MENVFFGTAVASFILAAACAIACAVVFVRLEVMDAIRFLRRRTVASGVGLVGVLARKPKQRKPKAEDLDRGTAPSSARKRGKGEKASGKRSDADSRTDDIRQKDPDSATIILASNKEPDSATGYLGDGGSMPISCVLAELDCETPTDLLSEEDPGSPTDLLAGEAPGFPADPLVDGSSENPTDLLAEEDSENPTDLLVAEGGSADSTGQLAEEGSENPASLLAGESPESQAGPPVAGAGEQPDEEALPGEDPEGTTELLAASEPPGRQATCLAQAKEESGITRARPEEETVFRLKAKQGQ